MFQIRNKTNDWFFQKPPLLFRFFLIFIKGDAIILFPLLICIFLTGFYSYKFMFLLLSLYMTFRSLGEMIYWLLQQFLGKGYRPYDFGFHNISNKAVCVLYQTLALAGLIVGTFAVIYILFF